MFVISVLCIVVVASLTQLATKWVIVIFETILQLKDCESIIKILESEIASKSPAIKAHKQTTAASIEALTGLYMYMYN